LQRGLLQFAVELDPHQGTGFKRRKKGATERLSRQPFLAIPSD